MTPISLKREVSGSFDAVVARVTAVLQEQGFGVLTRIDLDRKLEEKLGKKIARTAILGACNPALAYEAFTTNADVAALLPCNAVVREVAAGRCAVELARPSALLAVLGDERLAGPAKDADGKLAAALDRLPAQA